MKLLLDEMLSPMIAWQLRDRGYDVEATQQHPDWRSYEDREVIALARAERRAVVTDNLVDMRPLHYEAISPGGPGDYGMIFIPAGRPRTRANAAQMAAALEQKLLAYPSQSGLANAEDWL